MIQELKKETTATIKKQTILIKVNRSDIISADPTYDGIMFVLKHGLIIQFSDSFMSAESKQLISNSVTSFPNANLTIDLDNYKKPVVASVEK